MIHLRRAAGACALFAIVTIGSAGAEPVLPAAATPEDVGLSASQLQVNDGDRIMLRNQFRTMVQSAIIN